MKTSISKGAVWGVLAVSIVAPPVPIGCVMSQVEAAHGGDAYSNLLVERPSWFFAAWGTFSVLAFVGGVLEAKKRVRVDKPESRPDITSPK